MQHLYCIVLDGVEPWIVWAPDDEQAAWNALSLSRLLGLPLLDVIPYDSKRVPEQLAGDS
jgi:hypothetical protein